MGNNHNLEEADTNEIEENKRTSPSIPIIVILFELFSFAPSSPLLRNLQGPPRSSPYFHLNSDLFIQKKLGVGVEVGIGVGVGVGGEDISLINMGNCYGTPVVSHQTPCSTKPLSKELFKKDDKQNGLPAVQENGDMPVSENGKPAVETWRSKGHELPLPPSGKIVTQNLKVFTLTELKAATGNFKPATVLGEGGFGRVFKGWVDEKTYAPSKVGVGMAVAVKKSNPDSLQGLKEWQAEIKFLGKFSHPNLVKLLGYCWEENQFLLVYEYMQKGSLDNHLFRKGAEPLPWETRLKIVTGAAEGLAFLHSSEKSVIYRDFKAANILLDWDYNAKLSDFGLAKQGPINGQSHISTRPMGTHGYAAPEYIATGHLYVKSDVFGFGVVLLEMLTGMRAMDTNRPSGQLNLVEWAKPSLSQKKRLKKIMDPRLEDAYPTTGAIQVAEIILRCLESDPKNRPAMEDVLETLQRVSAIKVKSKDTDRPSSAASSSSSHRNLRGPIHSRHAGAGPGSRVHLHSRTATARAC